MKALLSIFALLLAFCASAQYPPPYVHNEADTNLLPVATSATNHQGILRNVSYSGSTNVYAVSWGNELTNFVWITPRGGLLGIAWALGEAGQAIAAQFASGLAQVDSSGNYNGAGYGSDLTHYIKMPNNASAIGQVITATSVTGDTAWAAASGGGGTGIATNGGGGFNNTLTNLYTENLTNRGAVTLFDRNRANPILLTNNSGNIYVTSPSGSLQSLIFNGQFIEALNADKITSGTVADARLSSQVALWSTNLTPPTMLVNTAAVGGLNFGATAVLISTRDVSLTNNAGVVIERRLSQRWNFTTGSSPSPTSWGTNTFPAFTQIESVKFSLLGQGWLTSGFNRQFIATTNSLNPLTSFAIQEVSQSVNGTLSHELGIEVVGK